MVGAGVWEWLVNNHLVNVGTDGTIRNRAGCSWEGSCLFGCFVRELIAGNVGVTRDPLDCHCSWDIEEEMTEICDVKAVSPELLA